MLSIRKILCPTDFSKYSTYAFEFACALAKHYGGRVEVLHVKHPPEIMYAQFAAIPADSFAITKRQIRNPGGDFDAEIQKIWSSPQAAAAMQAYLEKTLKK